MQNVLTEIEARLQKTFQTKKLRVLDESKYHAGHAGYRKEGSHFAIEIACDELNALPRIVAHRKIYALFSDLIPDTIHALKIKIIK